MTHRERLQKVADWLQVSDSMGEPPTMKGLRRQLRLIRRHLEAETPDLAERHYSLTRELLREEGGSNAR
jgi:hypothetical protein